MESRKETIKTIILILLVISSIFFSINIAGYRPDYEILGINSEKQKDTQDSSKLLNNTLNLLAPNIIVRKDAYGREEAVVSDSITKLATVPAIKNRDDIKDILRDISNSPVVETRIRNRNIDEIIGKSIRFYTMDYKLETDTLSSKLLYLGENNQTTSVEFNRVLISDATKNIIYLYKKDNPNNYMQVEFDHNVYDALETTFNDRFNFYGKYIINGNKEFYLRESTSNYTIDKYTVKDLNLSEVAENVFVNNNGLKVSSLDGNKEITDGYAILREGMLSINYINPSIMDKNTVLPTKEEVQARASSFFIAGYLPLIDFTLLKIEGNEIRYQEVYNESLVFSNDSLSVITANVLQNGVSRSSMPRIVRDEQIEKNYLEQFSLENADAVLNFIFKNIKLEDVSDIQLGYNKIYNEEDATITYIPKWYIEYKGKYTEFTELKNKVAKGEL